MALLLVLWVLYNSIHIKTFSLSFQLLKIPLVKKFAVKWSALVSYGIVEQSVKHHFRLSTSSVKLSGNKGITSSKSSHMLDKGFFNLRNKTTGMSVVIKLSNMGERSVSGALCAYQRTIDLVDGYQQLNGQSYGAWSKHNQDNDFDCCRFPIASFDCRSPAEYSSVLLSEVK